MGKLRAKEEREKKLNNKKTANVDGDDDSKDVAMALPNPASEEKAADVLMNESEEEKEKEMRRFYEEVLVAVPDINEKEPEKAADVLVAVAEEEKEQKAADEVLVDEAEEEKKEVA